MMSEPTDSASETSPLVLAILHELLAKLRDLAAKGWTSSIELRRLPLTSADREQLRALLGQGEVIAEISALGPSKITKTRFSGAWWVEHKNADGDKVGESIEIAPVPQMLPAAPSNTQEAADALAAVLGEVKPSPS
jgi:hydrogenase-1 operon protein HyaF